jgi:hypothetical protein
MNTAFLRTFLGHVPFDLAHFPFLFHDVVMLSLKQLIVLHASKQLPPKKNMLLGSNSPFPYDKSCFLMVLTQFSLDFWWFRQVILQAIEEAICTPQGRECLFWLRVLPGITRGLIIFLS